MSGLLWGGAAGAVLFVAVFTLDGVTRHGYRPGYHPVSALALGERGWLQRLNFCAAGALIAPSAVALHAALGSWPVTVLTAVFGLGLIGSGLFAMDPMRGYPPGTPAGTPESTSRAHRWHDNLGAVVFGSVPLLAVALGFAESGIWRWLAWGVAAVLALSAASFARAWEADGPRTGLIQRAFIVTGWTWFAAVCVHLALG